MQNHWCKTAKDRQTSKLIPVRGGWCDASRMRHEPEGLAAIVSLHSGLDVSILQNVVSLPLWVWRVTIKSQCLENDRSGPEASLDALKSLSAVKARALKGGKSKALWDTLRHERKWRGPRLYSKHEGGNMEMERNGLAKVVENQLRHAGDGACVAACFVWDQRYPSFDHLLRNGRMLKTWGATCLCLLHGILVSTLPGPCCFCWTFSKWPNLFMKTSHDQNTTDFRPRYNAALGGLLWFLNSKVFYFLHVHTSFWFIHNLSQFSIFQSVQRCSKPLYRVTSFGPGYQLQIWRTFLEDGQVLGTPCSVHCTSNFCICSILNLDMYSLSSLVTCQSCQSCQPCQPCQCCQPCQSCHFLLNNFCVHLSVGRPVLASL